jgi:NAD/NADP transhydrogenase beta subunit
MQTPRPQPEILLPRPGGGRRLFDDDNLDLLSHVLEDCFRIPGTRIRFGIDGIIGLIPGLGDIITGLAACIIVVAAWFRGVPYITLVRMLVNVAIDIVIGAIPFIGDVFDIAWKANRRNYKLLTRHLAEPHHHTWRDWIVLLLMTGTIGLILLAPILVLGWLIMHFVHGLGLR